MARATKKNVFNYSVLRDVARNMGGMGVVHALKLHRNEAFNNSTHQCRALASEGMLFLRTTQKRKGPQAGCLRAFCRGVYPITFAVSDHDRQISERFGDAEHDDAAAVFRACAVCLAQRGIAVHQ